MMAPMKRLVSIILVPIILYSLFVIRSLPVSAQETTRLIVKYRSSSESVHDRLESRLRLRSLRLRAPRTRLLRISSAQKDQVIESLQQNELVEYVEEDQPL